MQFHIYANEGLSAGETPYLLDLQAPFLNDLATRIVAPIRKNALCKNMNITKIHVPFVLRGEEYIAFVSEMAAIPEKYLGEEKGSLEYLRTEFTQAVDLIFTGF